MLLVDFINAYKSGVDKKTLGKMIKMLPVEDRKEAGVLFKTLKLKPKPEVKIKKINLGKLLESYDVGPFGGGLYIYEDGWRVPARDRYGYYSHYVIITGTNLKFKIIKPSQFKG